MKQFILSLMLASLFIQGSVSAEEVKETRSESLEIEIQGTSPAEVEPAPQRKSKNNSDLQNWLFAAGSIICATAAIVVVSLNQGSSPTPTPQ